MSGVIGALGGGAIGLAVGLVFAGFVLFCVAKVILAILEMVDGGGNNNT